MMLQEIEAAVNFLTRLVAKSAEPGGSKSKDVSTNGHGKPLSEDKIQEFSRRLTTVLQNRFRDHWYPEKPTRGQAFRCMRINENCSMDSSIAKACHECGISYEALRLPVELTLWIDPNEVTCRFGEHKGSYCVVAKLSDGRQENYVNSINIEELEQQSLEHSKQSSFDIINSRKKRQQALLHQRTKNVMALFNGGNSTTYHSQHQSMNGSLTNGNSPAPHLSNSSPGHGHVPVTSATQSMNGYVDYGHNGLLPTTSSGPVSIQPQFHSHFGSQQANAHFYPNSGPSPFQHHVVSPHSTHFGTNHIFTKYSLGLQQSQQVPSPAGQLGGGRALNAASLAASGTFRSNLASNTNSVGSKQVNAYHSSTNTHHTVSTAAASTVIASLGASHHSTSNGSNGGSKPFSSKSMVNNSNASSFARDYQQSLDKDRRHLTTAASATAIATNRF